MVMDLIILGIFLLAIVVSAIRGFAMTLISFLKGIVSLIVSWIFADDLANIAIEKTELGKNVQAAIESFLSTKWETSQIYQSLPELFKGSESALSQTLIHGGSEKLSVIFITILCFVIIWVTIRLVLALFGLLFSKKHQDGAVGKVDTILGLLLGVLMGAFYAYLLLALIVPVTGFIIPNHSETILGWFTDSRFSKWMYDNNLLLILFRDFILKL